MTDAVKIYLEIARKSESDPENNLLVDRSERIWKDLSGEERRFTDCYLTSRDYLKNLHRDYSEETIDYFCEMHARMAIGDYRMWNRQIAWDVLGV